MGEFTKGPWVKDKYGELRGIEGQQVEVYSTGIATVLSGPTETAVANAHLVTAAPCMFEALRTLRPIVSAEIKRGLGIFSDDHLAQIDGALRKAQGDSP